MGRLRLALLCALVALGAMAGPARGAVIASNPVLTGDWPDPTVLRDGGAWWAATTATSRRGMPLLTSSDLVHWRRVGPLLRARPRWTRGRSFWAPALTRWGDRYLVYYSARRHDGRLCVAVATAPAVVGPYDDAGPMTCQPVGSIDPDPVVDERGAGWLVWKEDGNSARRPTRLWARRLSSDGLRLWGPKRLLLANSARWDHGIVEGPEIVRRDGWMYLFFSGGACCSLRCSYALGVARSRSLLGPWVEDRRNPILRDNASWRCPGHATFAQDGAGHWYMLYHAVPRRARVFARELLLDELHFGGGWPSVNGGRGPSTHVVFPVLAPLLTQLAGQPVER